MITHETDPHAYTATLALAHTIMYVHSHIYALSRKHTNALTHSRVHTSAHLHTQVRIQTYAYAHATIHTLAYGSTLSLTSHTCLRTHIYACSVKFAHSCTRSSSWIHVRAYINVNIHMQPCVHERTWHTHWYICACIHWFQKV